MSPTITVIPLCKSYHKQPTTGQVSLEKCQLGGWKTEDTQPVQTGTADQELKVSPQ